MPNDLTHHDISPVSKISDSVIVIVVVSKPKEKPIYGNTDKDRIKVHRRNKRKNSHHEEHIWMGFLHTIEAYAKLESAYVTSH